MPAAAKALTGASAVMVIVQAVNKEGSVFLSIGILHLADE
jgi:hypothetical protein